MFVISVIQRVILLIQHVHVMHRVMVMLHVRVTLVVIQMFVIRVMHPVMVTCHVHVMHHVFQMVVTYAIHPVMVMHHVRVTQHVLVMLIVLVIHHVIIIMHVHVTIPVSAAVSLINFRDVGHVIHLVIDIHHVRVTILVMVMLIVRVMHLVIITLYVHVTQHVMAMFVLRVIPLVTVMRHVHVTQLVIRTYVIYVTPVVTAMLHVRVIQHVSPILHVRYVTRHVIPMVVINVMPHVSAILRVRYVIIHVIPMVAINVMPHVSAILHVRHVIIHVIQMAATSAMPHVSAILHVRHVIIHVIQMFVTNVMQPVTQVILHVHVIVHVTQMHVINVMPPVLKKDVHHVTAPHSDIHGHKINCKCEEIMIVHGLNKAREIIERKLHTKKDGVYLDNTLIEPDVNLFNKYYRPDDPSEGFLNAFYQITNKCNKQCEYCYNRYLLLHHPGNTSVQQLVQSLEDFVPADHRDVQPFRDYVFDGFRPTISFIGGEPTVAPELPAFVHYICASRNNKVYIYTNGIILADPDFLKQFPNTSQIMWSISTDKNTTQEFLMEILQNLETYTNHEYGFNIIVGEQESTKKKNLQLNDYMLKWNPEEIRYRAVCDQLKGHSDYLSNVIKFIEKARGIDYDYYVNNAKIGHGGYVSSLKTDNGKIAAAMLPVWDRTFAELVSAWGSFVLNTTHINAPGECHMNSPELYKWRMAHTEKYISEGTKPIWGKINPYVEMRRCGDDPECKNCIHGKAHSCN